jgi:hypothetical protein
VTRFLAETRSTYTPCIPVSSDSVSLGPVPVVQSCSGVCGRLAWSGVA